jgi:outer membrane protein OmpA-like peptidoglycan-associated protein
MRKLLISTTALSVALSPLSGVPAFSQTLAEDGSVLGPDGAVLCAPTAETACDLEAITEALRATEAEAAAQAEAEAAAQAAAEAEAEAAAQAEAEAAAQAAAEAEAAAQAEAEAAAQAAAEAEAAAQAEAEAAAQAAAEAEAAAQAEAEAAAQAAAEAEAAAQAEAEAAAQAAAEAEAAAQAEAEAAAQAAADAEAAAQAEAEAAAQAAAEAEAAAAQAETDAEAAAQADTEAADQAAAEADAAAQAEAEAAAQAAAEAEAAAAQAEAEAAAQAAAEAEAAAQAEAEADAAAQAEADAAAQAEAEAAAQAAADTDTAAQAETEAVTEDAGALLPEASVDTAIEALGEGAIDPATGAPLDAEAAAAAAAALAAAEAELQVSETGEIIDPAAGLKVAEPEIVDDSAAVDAPVITETEVEGLTQLLTVDPTAIDPEAIAAAAVVTAPPTAEEGTVSLAPADPEVLIGTVTETLTESSVRTSAEEFAAPPRRREDGRKSGLSDLEKAGLVVLGALVVGSIIKSANDGQEDRRVVSNTGDRVVMLLPDGSYQILKDDDAVIRQPGSTVRTETFRDGSTRTIVERTDGTQVVTIRDATGRVLRRAAYDDRGREIVLIDDLQREEVVIVEDLPRPRKPIVISSKDNDIALKRELAALEADRVGRKFSLRQIREIPQVRALAATIDVEPVTFATGSAAIAATEARNLADLGRVMQDLLAENPGEVFLIEGHTDATGRAALNLALSDRRAESVALALTEYFDIPPENMVVQGYGETELLIDTQESETANRRVEVRVITPLMRTAALR